MNSHCNGKYGPQNNIELNAWRALNAAYDAHFRRVYDMSPTNKCISCDDERTLTTCFAEAATLFEARLRERNVDATSLDKTPMELLADEALRTWLNKPGKHNFLRNVSHPLHRLLVDFAYQVREAEKALVEKYAPKPAPRLAPVVPLPIRIKPREEFAPACPVQVPTLPAMHAHLARPATPREICQETKRILDGLSARTALAELGTDVSLATELSALARDHGVDAARVLSVLDDVAQVVVRTEGSTNKPKRDVVFVAVVDALAQGPRA